jgi:hypothetical protein
MRKGVEFVVGAIVAGAVAAVIISSERAELKVLKSKVEFLQSERDEAVNRAKDERLSELMAQSDQWKAPANEPSREVLRLRGEIGRLRGELDSAQDQKSKNAAKTEEHQLGSASVSPLAVTEIDLDGFMNFANGATTNEVLVELQRVGAQLVAQERGFIEAGVSLPTTNAGLSSSVLLEFYFDGDRLSSRKYTRLP